MAIVSSLPISIRIALPLMAVTAPSRTKHVWS
jgi:hypothetical protein